ncbi:MAG: hypothetical protein NTU44_08025 [Bacteroidetes bacterium]|nr:hypothetical protein [Bacteroidota bacterium]
MKKFLKISAWVLFTSSLFVMVGFIEVEQQKVICKGIEITLDQADENSFLTKAEIKYTVEQLLGDSVKGKPLKQISISLIRDRLQENEYVKKALVYSTVDGILKVVISQRTPILRVQAANGRSFYISNDGRMIPVSYQYTARVPLANGVISESFDPQTDLTPSILLTADLNDKITTLQKLYLLGKYISGNEFLSAQVAQIYVNADGEFEMVPIVGNHIILFGNANDLEEKFNKLICFYLNGLKTAGWNTYKTINIKYKNQVICSKN